MNCEILIRDALIEDAESLLNIYSPYVKNTAITFEWVVPTIQEFKKRIEKISARYPYIVAEVNGEIRGYAYANTFRSRKAYSWTAESSIYVHQDYRGKGIGKQLLIELESRLAKQNVLNLYAVIASTDKEDEYLTNDSVRFHKKMGYTNPCIFNKCGFKFNRWYDTTTMEKFLGEHTANPVPAVKENNFVPSIDLIHNKYSSLTKFLIKNNMKITAMESCTSGFVSSLITDTEGSSAIFKGSCVTYSNEAKELNGVDKSVIENFGVYSTKTAEEMSRACVKMYPSEIGIGITGSFGNIDPANSDSIPGKVFIAVNINNDITVCEYSLEVNISRYESKLCVADKTFDLINSKLNFYN